MNSQSKKSLRLFESMPSRSHAIALAPVMQSELDSSR